MKKIMSTFLACTIFLMIENNVHAQKLVQEKEKVNWVSTDGLMGVKWSTSWEQPKNANVNKSGLLTYASVFGYFILPDGNKHNFNEFNIITRSSGAQKGKIFPLDFIDIPVIAGRQRTANVVSVHFRVRIRSVLWTNSTSNFISASWTSDWFSYQYR